LKRHRKAVGGKYVIKGKGYPTLVAQVTDPSITFVTGEAGQETTQFVTALNTWEKVGSIVWFLSHFGEYYEIVGVINHH
jgi:hypothetical protein